MTNQHRSDWRPMAAALFDVCGARAMIKQLRSGMGQGHIKITRLLHFMSKATSAIYWSFEKLHISHLKKKAPANDYPITQTWRATSQTRYSSTM